MKNRSHRLPISDPPDDWVDGSWTVDCVCGINFDDGEEMVNCDECGVWVHTRCSRYVKSEKSFACDKCKSKNARTDSEETEVAQLLVELPTKTLRLGNPSGPPPRRPFRLWTDRPIEERVHVQGIPGGDPVLFSGMSSVFSPQLWKCTGYVPKKFNFQYREFPSWDETCDVDKKMDDDNENPVDKGAGVLFSLSKDNVLPTPVATLVGMKKQAEKGGCDRLPSSKDTNTWEGEDLDVKRLQNGAKKDCGLLQPSVIHSGKRKKEGMGASKDRSGKKKARTIDKEGDSKKRDAHASKTVSTISSDGKQLEFYEDRGPKVPKIDTQSSKNRNARDTVPTDPLLTDYRVADKDVGNPENNLVLSQHPSEALSSDVAKQNSSIEARPKKDSADHQVSARIETSRKTDDAVASSLEHNDSGSIPSKEEVGNDAVHNLVGKGGGPVRSVVIDSHKSEPLVEDVATAAPEVKDDQNFQGHNFDMLPSTSQPNINVKAEVDMDNSVGVSNVQSSPANDVMLDGSHGTKPLAQHAGISAEQLSENVKVDDAAMASSQSSDHKVQDIDRSIEVISDCKIDRADESPGDLCQPKQQLEGSEGSMAVQKNSSELEHNSKPTEDPSKSGCTISSPSAPSNQSKVVVSAGKCSSASSTIGMSKPSVSDNYRHSNAPNDNFTTKQRGISDHTVSSKKDNASTDAVKDEDGHEMHKKTGKELQKSCVSSLLKPSHSSKLSHASVSKKMPDSKDPLPPSPSKTSSVQNTAATPDSNKSASSLQNECALHVQNKITASGLPQKGEKINQSNCKPSSKANHIPPMHPSAASNSPATLSDEELALLLHHELNSSPRVPRVPRIRHAGSLPQLGSPTATSMLMKRASSSGGKDHCLVPRRKNKDLTKDGLRNSRDLGAEAKKVDRVLSSPDQRRQDWACTADPVKEEADNGLSKGVYSVKKSVSPASAATASSGPSSSTEANEQNLSSIRNTPRNASDDDTGTVGCPTHRTLPGLIAEIMSKGKRMTYEELCNAVLPHWPNLRKHNGERYAYSSHSLAVLDCLRNRNEWARLVDRGPKTNASRKRRKFDPDPSSFESEDNEYSKERSTKDVESKSFESHQEEFPKGKRKARKRRRLALQGRGVKDLRRRRKADIVSDDDIGSFSNSSEASMFSEDEIQEGGTCPVGSEASASSDETGAMF